MFRTTSRRTLIAAAALAMTGCGFRLRGRFTLPFETLYISYNLNTPLGSQLSRQLKAGSDVRLVNSPSEAQAILYILGERRSRNVVAYNAYGDAREYELKLEVSFRLAAPDGALYLPDVQLSGSLDQSQRAEALSTSRSVAPSSRALVRRRSAASSIRSGSSPVITHRGARGVRAR